MANRVPLCDHCEECDYWGPGCETDTAKCPWLGVDPLDDPMYKMKEDE